MPLCTLESSPRIPEQVANAVQQVKQKCECPAEQNGEPDRAAEKPRGRDIGFRTARQGHEPIAQGNETQRQRRAGDPVQNRQRVADLPAIDSGVRRGRTGACGHQLKIDAAATEFPITEARRLRAFASADLGRRFRGRRRRSLCGRRCSHGIFGSRRHHESLPEIRDKRCIHKGLTSRVPHPSHI